MKKHLMQLTLLCGILTLSLCPSVLFTQQLLVDFGTAGSLRMGTPSGNGPGLIHIAPDGDRWDAFSWNGGYQIRRTGTNNIFQFSDNGSMGIGTETPDGQLDIDFGSTGSLVAATPGGNGPGWLYYAPNGNRWDTYASVIDFTIARSGSNSIFSFSNDGKFGIKLGNTVASTDLHVKQTGGDNYNTNGLRLEYGDNANYWTTLIDSGNDYLLAYKGNWRAWFSEIDGAYNQSSDRKVKQDIEQIPTVLDRVNQLRPVTYKYKAHADAQRPSWGFIAQEVEPLFPDFVSEKQGIKGLAYHNFAVVSIKAIQELSAIIDEQQEEIEDLKTTVRQLQAQIQEVLSKIANSPEDNTYSLSLKQEASLAQNQPNPFNQRTTVRFFVPENIQKAQVRITNAEGKVLEEVEIGRKGAGQINIEARTYPAGTYYYSLILDGELFQTLRMVLTR